MSKDIMIELLCGKNTVKDAINNGMNIKEIFTTRKEELPKTSIPINVVNRHFLDKMTHQNHQGFIAVLKDFNYFTLSDILRDVPQDVLILDHIQDPHNLGAIVRSANAFGVRYIIIPKDRAAHVTSSAMKVASGGFANVKIVLVNSLIDAVNKLKKNNYWIYASNLDEKASNIENVSFNKPTCIIVGNEAKGVSRTLLKTSDQNIYIKMIGTVQSLNVSVATAIILYKL